MSDLIVNTTAREAAAAVAQAAANASNARIQIPNPIITPPAEAATAAVEPWVVSGFYLDLTVFIIGTILLLMVFYLIILKIFGQPLGVASEAATGGSIIEHFNTSKSAIMKVAKVSGGAFQYKDIRDGTVAATPKSVLNVNGRQLVLTYAQLGMTLSAKHLAGVSVLVHKGINNLTELKEKYYKHVIPVTVLKDTEGNEVQEPAGEEYDELNDEELVTGYDFNDFNKIIKQSQHENLLPLTIEAVQPFLNRNVNADYTELDLTLQAQLDNENTPETGHTGQILGIAIAIALMIMASTAIK